MALNTNFDDVNQFDLYFGSTSTEPYPLIVFVHGGAWRSEDKADHAELAQRLAKSTGYAVAVPNYRLSTAANALHHPAHSEDVLRFLYALPTWQSPRPLDLSRLYLIGHSCSAHMLASIFCDSSPITPSLTPDDWLLSSVRGIICSEGIYDLDRLLERYPEYKSWFIRDAFGDRAEYADYSITQYTPRDPRIHWLIIHSSGDTLIDRSQSDAMIAHLTTAGCPVKSILDHFADEHDDLLRTDGYVQTVSEFIRQVQ